MMISSHSNNPSADDDSILHTDPADAEGTSQNLAPTKTIATSLDFLISSGGTRVPIDSVRCLTNYSKGTTGSLIAEHALSLGHSVRFICSNDSKQPYSSALILNPKEELDQELNRLRFIAEEYKRHEDRLEVVEVRDFNEYHHMLREHVIDPTTDVVILCMAASDYAPEEHQGKISSSSDSPTLELKPLPKLISEVKQIRRNVFLVGFKLLIGEDPDVVVDRAYRSMLRDGQDLAVANVGDSMNPESLATYLVTIEKGIIPVPRAQLPEVLLQTVQNRHSKEYYRTELQTVERLPLQPHDVQTFLDTVKHCSQLALFNPYVEDSREEFGFYASRTDQGTLITARGSSKTNADSHEIALITDVDEKQRLLKVVTIDKKASLNANVAHLIFETRPEIKHILHAHITLPQAISTAHETAPGTQDDWEMIRPLVEDGERLIYQPNHGVMILLESHEELIPILERNGIYQNNAEKYDLAYSRFLKNSSLTDTAAIELPKDSRVLDFACGTGEVTQELLRLGFNDITLVDQSTKMIDVAKNKIGSATNLTYYKDTFETFSSNEAYEGIIVRQAINYVAPGELEEVFTRFNHALGTGGKLIFNTFAFDHTDTPRARTSRDQSGEYITITQEGNVIEDGLIHHGQRTEVFDKSTGEYQLFYDLNSFYIIEEQEFVEALNLAGFSSVHVSRHGRSLTFVCEK